MASLNDLKALLSRFGIGDEYSTDDAELVHLMLEKLHQHFGVVRFKIGALLLAIKYKELWKGKARSFNEYLEGERIKLSAANQYMQVAEKLMFELKLNNEQLVSLSRISMTTLVKACEKINKENADEIVGLLECLSDRDARHALDDMESHRRPLHQSDKRSATSPKVRKLLNDYYSLPNDLRVELLQELRTAGAPPKEAGRVALAAPQAQLQQTPLAPSNPTLH